MRKEIISRGQRTTFEARVPRDDLLHHRMQDDVPVVDRLVVALEVDRARTKFVGPERTTGAAENRLVVDDLHPVQDHRQMSIDEGDVEGLPFIGSLGGIRSGRDAAIEASDTMGVRGAVVGVGDLDLVDAAKVDAAVALGRDFGFEGDAEILEFAIGTNVSVVFACGFVGSIDEGAILDAPAIGRFGFDETPAAQILAVEQMDGRGVIHLRQVGFGRERGDAFSGEAGLIQTSAVLTRVELNEVERVTVDGGGEEFGKLLGADDLSGGVLAFHFAKAGHVETPVVEVHRGDGEDTASTPENGAVVPTAFFADLEPAGAAVGQRQGPTSEEGVIGQGGGRG